MLKPKNGRNSAITSPTEKKGSLYFLCLFCIYNIKRFLTILKCNRQTDGQAQTSMPPLNFFEVGGIKVSKYCYTVLLRYHIFDQTYNLNMIIVFLCRM